MLITFNVPMRRQGYEYSLDQSLDLELSSVLLRLHNKFETGLSGFNPTLFPLRLFYPLYHSPVPWLTLAVNDPMPNRKKIILR